MLKRTLNLFEKLLYLDIDDPNKKVKRGYGNLQEELKEEEERKKREEEERLALGACRT